MKHLRMIIFGMCLALSALLCAPFVAIATEENPYGIIFGEGYAGSVSALLDDDPSLEAIEEESAYRLQGLDSEYQNLPLVGEWPQYGDALSPFTLNSNDTVVELSMDAPSLSGAQEDFVGEGVPHFRLAVQDASNPNAPIYFVMMENDESNANRLNVAVPMVAETVRCAVLLRNPGMGWEADLTSDQHTYTDPVLENAYGSAVHYSWTFQMSEKNAAGLAIASYYRYFDVNFTIFTGDAVLDEESVKVNCAGWQLGEITDNHDGSYSVTLEMPEGVTGTTQLTKATMTQPITISFDALLSEEDYADEKTLSAVIDFAYHKEDVSGVPQGCVCATSGVMTAEMEPAVTVKPVDMTVYEGGSQGYDDVVDPDGEQGTHDGSLPEPLFYIVPSDETPDVKPTDLVFTKGAEQSADKRWTVEEAGKDAEGTPLYKFDASDGTQDVRVTYTDADGNAVLSDQFDPSEVGDLCTTYSIDIYPGDEEGDADEKVQAQPKQGSGDSSQYPVSLSSGTLTVRAVDAEEEMGVTTLVATSVTEPVKSGEGAAVAPTGTTYKLNNTDVVIPSTDGVSLLFDGIIDDAGTNNRTGALQNKIDEEFGAAESGFTRNYQAQYLDLVDVNNGNAWVTASDNVTVYWGYPEGTGQSTDFTLYHFKDLHRDGAYSGFKIEDLNSSDIEEVTIEKDANGIVFYVQPGGFSPFVLTWDTDARHTITATAGAGGTISPSDEVKVANGESATFTITPNSGYVVDDVKVDGASKGAITTYTFTNVNENHTISATFRSTGGPVIPPTTRYTITASAGEGGSISPSGSVSVTAGTSRTFTVTPDEGHKVIDVVVDGESVGPLASYTFENVRADHAISASFTRGNAPADPGDTGVDEWFDVTNHGAFLHGYADGSGLFGPDNNMTRAEAAQMFYNMLKDKAPGDIEITFPDVDEGAWYADAVGVLASHGIVRGDGLTGTFRPADPISRAEFTAIAMRFSKGDVSGENIFTDVHEGDWFYDVVVGSVKYGWINGYQDGSGRFGPADTLTRADATAIANRMLGRVPDGVWIARHTDELKLFPDVPESHYAWRDIVEATNAHGYERDGIYEKWTGLTK